MLPAEALARVLVMAKTVPFYLLVCRKTNRQNDTVGLLWRSRSAGAVRRGKISAMAFSHG